MECVECVEDMHHLLPNCNIRKYAPIILGGLTPLLIPTVYFSGVYSLWANYKGTVNREECTNSCWDSIYKGSYEESPARYKHIYFNCTWNTFVIYSIIVMTTVTWYEVGKNCVKLVARKQARVPMLALLAVSVYPHFYAVWMYFNAINDDFYDQIWHQGIFSLTEVISSICVYQMCSNQKPISGRKLLLIATIACFHLVANAVDQFVFNVVQRKGEWHQINRDLSFISVDLIHLVVAGWQLLKLRSRSKQKTMEHQSDMKSDLCYSVSTVFILVMLTRII